MNENPCVEMVRLLHAASHPSRMALYHQWLLDNGKEFIKKRNQNRSLELQISHGLRVKECYYNCQKLALLGIGEYCEGYADGSIPVEHAWLVDGDGTVIDPTWAANENLVGGSYFGVKIPEDLIRESWQKTELARPLLWEFVGWQFDTEERR